MSSATGVPDTFRPQDEAANTRQSETEPLLGRPGDAAQVDGVPMVRNLVLGKSTGTDDPRVKIFMLMVTQALVSSRNWELCCLSFSFGPASSPNH